MKAVILAGGLGSRISEETHLKPKPMIEIGGRPILWHIMKMFSAHGINDFIICCGHKGYIIKEYFANYFLYMSDITFGLKNNEMHVHRKFVEDWRVTLLDTGLGTMTGGRLKRVAEYLDPNEPFCFTYGDGVSDLNIRELVVSHRAANVEATVTAIQPEGRFGALEVNGDMVTSFEEKPRGDGHWINGGFFVCEPSVLNYIDGDATSWEGDPLRQLALEGQLAVYRHQGFWAAMDTLRDKVRLERQWNDGSAPWKIWD